jgi:hypothetical protein
VLPCQRVAYQQPPNQRLPCTCSGAVYEGEWKAGKYHGQGTYTWPDGRVYKVRGLRIPSPAVPLQQQLQGGQTAVSSKQAWRHPGSIPLLIPGCTLQQGWTLDLPPCLPCLQGQWEDNAMHGPGTYIDSEGHEWCGQFMNGSGPGLTYQL